MQVEQIRFKDQTAKKVETSAESNLLAAIEALGLVSNRPVIVLVGGAGGIQEKDWEAIHDAIGTIAKVAEKVKATMIDGGTASGVMMVSGKKRAVGNFHYPLIGVSAIDTVTWPGREQNILKRLRDKRAPLDPNHTHFILVPGENWGDESVWIAEVATQIAGSKPSVTILINGGRISHDQDVPNSLRAGRPVLVIEGTGRAADEFATHPPETNLMRFIHISELDRLASELQKNLSKTS